MLPTAVLLIWPFLAMAFFAALGPARGLIWSTVIGYLFLPEYTILVALPGLPLYSKAFSISMGMLFGILISASQDPSRPETRDKTIRFIMLALLAMIPLGFLFTILDNPAPLIRGGRFQPGQKVTDIVQMTTTAFVGIIPFLVARRWLADPKHHIELLKVFVIFGIVYSVLVVFEARMSPQLNSMIYGFFPHSWRQHIRGGGFRAIVFLAHGLSVGFFLFLAVVSACALARHYTGRARVLALMAAFYLLPVLLLSRNLGATLMAAALIPLVLMLGKRWQIGVAAAIALIFISYPVSRANLPTERFLSVIESYSPERAQSLAFRLRNEDLLVEHALQKPLFGWGGWGRNRVIDDRGRDISVTDGTWIIRLGSYGIFGYFTFFGLLAIPVIYLWRRRSASYPTIALGLIVAAALFYSIPNAELRTLVWLCGGALAGYLQFHATRETAEAEEPGPEPELPTERMAYSRFAPKSGKARPSPYSRSLNS